MLIQGIHTDGQQRGEKMSNITSYKGNENHNHKRYRLTPARVAVINKTGVGEDMVEREPWRTAGENVNWCNLYGK